MADNHVDILLEIKNELGKLTSTVSSVKNDVDDLKKLMVQVIRIEEKQLEMERNQKQLLHMRDNVERAITDIELIKKDLNNLGDKIRKIEIARKSTSDNIVKFLFSILEKAIVWVIITLLALKEFVHK